jgi:hypothetical protein
MTQRACRLARKSPPAEFIKPDWLRVSEGAGGA